jgi:hypothetical protein
MCKEIDPIKNIPKKDDDFEEDFDYGSFLGCDDDASQEEIDQAWDDQMC